MPTSIHRPLPSRSVPADRPNAYAGRARYGLTVLTCAAALLLAACDKEKAAPAPVVPVVQVVEAAQRDVPITMEWVGAMDGNIKDTPPVVFVPLATETGEWLYFAPADVKRVQFTPVPAEEETNGDVQTVS